MTTQRIVPSVLNKKVTQTTAAPEGSAYLGDRIRVRPHNPYPQTTGAHQVKSGAQTANNNTNEDPNRCPICFKPYQNSRANGHPVKVCMDHRIVMPVQDQS